MGKTTVTGIAIAAVVALGSGAPASSATKFVDISNCVNNQFSGGQPVGKTKGNTGTPQSDIRFDLMDPGAGSNIWLGAAGAAIDIKVSITGASAVYALINTYYCQSGIANATVTLKGSGGAH